MPTDPSPVPPNGHWTFGIEWSLVIGNWSFRLERQSARTDGPGSYPEKLSAGCLDVPEEEKTCKDCGCAKCEIGEEVSDQLDVLPMRTISA